MISLRELFRQAFPDFSNTLSFPDSPIRGVACDSRKVEKDFLFVAIRGVKKNGYAFIDEAISRGAVAIVGEEEENVSTQLPFIPVPESRQALARLAGAYYGHPSRGMTMVGITGTNGKTTSTFLIEHLLAKENQKVGVIGTVNIRFGTQSIPAVETTPGPLQVQRVLAQMREQACRYVVMETSSHALDQHRVGGIDFDAALFTNLTQDHLDYHETLERYFDCKSRLFLGLRSDKTAVLNQDDPWAMKLKDRVSCKVVTYGVQQEAMFRAQGIQYKRGSTAFELSWNQKKVWVEVPLIGLHNIYNFLGSLAVVASLGFSVEKAVHNIRDFTGVPGRLEAVSMGQAFSVFIDFAHTPDGLTNVLSALLPYKKNRLMVVFGCGGERDKTKRPQMGRIAASFCDFVYLTSDNPRSEDARTIAEEIQSGFPPDFKKYVVVLDRKKAVRQVLLSAKGEDIVVLAGKGHESTQIIAGESFPYNDREEAERVLRGR